MSRLCQIVETEIGVLVLNSKPFTILVQISRDLISLLFHCNRTCYFGKQVMV